MVKLAPFCKITVPISKDAEAWVPRRSIGVWGVLGVYNKKTARYSSSTALSQRVLSH